VRMIEIRGDLDLAEESLWPKSSRQLGTEYFDGYLAFMSEVASKIDRGHSATADLALDCVAVGQCGLQAALVGRHVWRLQVP